MNIVFFTKRQYTGKDLIDDRYGRLFEIPRLLSELGHNVVGVCVSYRKRNQGLVIKDEKNNWFSFNSHFLLNGLFHFFKDVFPLVRSLQPDVIVGSSDSLNIIVSYCLSRYLQITYVVDLYDNFDSFFITRIPIVNYLFRKAVINADVVICVSQPLVDYVKKKYMPKGEVYIIENAINESDFFSLDRNDAREMMGFSKDAILIGTLGELDQSRNINVLINAITKIAESNGKVKLLMAGRLNCDISGRKNIQFIGDIEYDKVKYFLNSLDVAVICLSESLFCRYCFPQKFYEILSCQIPFMSAGIGVMNSMLSDYPHLLFNPENAEDLANKLTDLISEPALPEIKVKTWAMQARLFESVLIENKK